MRVDHDPVHRRNTVHGAGLSAVCYHLAPIAEIEGLAVAFLPLVVAVGWMVVDVRLDGGQLGPDTDTTTEEGSPA
jgi:hypothetical protein